MLLFIIFSTLSFLLLIEGKNRSNGEIISQWDKEVKSLTTSEKTKALVEGALFAVIAAIFGMAGMLFPFLSVLTSLIIPIPIIIVIRKYSLKTGLMSLLVMFFLITVLTGNPLSGIFQVLQYGGLAIVYGLAFKNGFSAGKTIFAGGLTFLLFFAFSLVVSFFLTGINPLDIGNVVKESVDQTMRIMQESGQMAEIAKRGVSESEFRTQIYEMMNLIKTLFPSMILVSVSALAYLTYALARTVSKKLSFTVPQLVSFKEWRLPWYTIWILILGIGSTLLSEQIGFGALKAVGANLTFIGVLTFFLVGLSLIIYFYKKTQFSRFMKIIFVVFLILNLPVGFWFIALIGLMDTILNLRRFGAIKKS